MSLGSPPPAQPSGAMPHNIRDSLAMMKARLAPLLRYLTGTQNGVIANAKNIQITGAGLSVGAAANGFQPGEIATSTEASPTNGTIYFGNTTTHYLWFDGTTFRLNGPLLIGTRPAFVAGDKYLVVDSSGNVHVSSLGPAS